jgi:hypothetical protein
MRDRGRVAAVRRNGVELPRDPEVVPGRDDQNVVIEVPYPPGEHGRDDGFGAFLESEPAHQVLTTQGYLP